MKNLRPTLEALAIIVLIYCLLFLCSFITQKKYPYAHDGDTIEVMDSTTHHQLGIRLANIDAPELAQQYGGNSRDSLQWFMSHQKLSIEILNIDKYGRKVAILRFNNCRYDSIAVMRGWAYVYPQYCHYPMLFQLQILAAKNKMGIWAIQPQQRPWEYRHQKK